MCVYAGERLYVCVHVCESLYSLFVCVCVCVCVCDLFFR